jgi:hypothetical protein
MPFNSCLAIALFVSVATAHAGTPGVADFVKQIHASKGKVVLDKTGVPIEVYLYNKAFSDADLTLLKPFAGLKVLNVQHARVSDAGVAQVVAAHPGIEKINIHDTLVTPACVKDLAKLKALHTIEIFGKHVTDDWVRELRAHGLLHRWQQAGASGRFKSPADVTGISLDFTRISVAGLKEFADFTGLVYLKYDTVDDATLRTLAEMKLLHALWVVDESVSLDRRPRSPADVVRFSLSRPHGVTAEGLKELRIFTGLKALELHAFHANQDAMKVIASFKSLESIRFGPMTSDAGLEELAALPYLHDLWLADARATDAGLKEIARIKTLRTLNVNGTKVSAAGLKHLFGLPLKRLDVSPAILTDETLEVLREKKMLHTLGIAKGKAGGNTSEDDIVFLALSGAPITDASVKMLIEMKSLTGVALNGTRVTDQGVAELRAARPKLYVRR